MTKSKPLAISLRIRITLIRIRTRTWSRLFFYWGSGSDFSLWCGISSSWTWWESATTELKTLQGSIVNLLGSIVSLNYSIYEPPWLHIEPPELQETLMRIWIRLWLRYESGSGLSLWCGSGSVTLPWLKWCTPRLDLSDLAWGSLQVPLAKTDRKT